MSILKGPQIVFCLLFYIIVFSGKGSKATRAQGTVCKQLLKAGDCGIESFHDHVNVFQDPHHCRQ